MGDQMTNGLASIGCSLALCYRRGRGSVTGGVGDCGGNDLKKEDQMGDNEIEDDDERITILCSRCGKPTTFDPTYGDLCYRCCRADNE